MARAIMHNKDVAKNLWDKAMTIAYHTVKRVYFRLGTKKTPYELWKGKKPNVKYFRKFGSIFFILKDRENEGKFDTQSDEGVFLGYSSSSKAYRVLNKRIGKVMEIVNVRALYGLKQAPRAWYDHLTDYLVANELSKGQADRTLFIKKVDGKLVIAQIEFEMSMIGKLNYFLGLQIWQNDSDIFISQSKYANDIVKKFGLEFACSAGNVDDCKSTSGGCFYLGNNLVSWMSKK
ncbi:uncharacterized protein LOC126704920 [Quercus robur]|uniref:uncharacterized protein LOC126704920 n=1 Tax=Quercus robur TaxID=38942 RepID=UPI0021637B9E|nr:uncharacterized protein LOC126704920 [Quercus robur]